MGNGLSLRLSQNDGHKLKNKKENQIMKNRKNILTYIIAAFSILVASASSLPAAPAQTYHGIFTGGTFYCGGTPVPVFTVTGNWNVSIDPKTPAQSHAQRLLRRKPSPGVRLQRADAGLVRRRRLRVRRVRRRSDGDARYKMQTPATFSWHVELGGGCPPEHPYNSLTYFRIGEPRRWIERTALMTRSYRKPKTEKEINIMKNRNIQFKPTAGTSHPAAARLLCCSVCLGSRSGNSRGYLCRSKALSRVQSFECASGRVPRAF
jgi:hypothetical protein